MKKLFVLFSCLFAFGCSKSDSGSKAVGIQYKTPKTEFVYNGRAEPDFLDPHRSWAHDSAQIIMQLLEGLLTRDADYMTIKPGLASEWKVSDDQLTYTFTMREGAKWSNGDPITAEHARQSFIRAMDPKIAAPYVAWYTDFIEGAADFVKNFNSPKRAEFEKKLGITVSGNQVSIKLVKPVSYFKYLVAQSPFYITHPSMYDPSSPAWTDPTKFISNSAFVLKEWRVNDRIVLEKNPQYYDAANTGIDRVSILVLTEQPAVYNMYQSGQLDWTNNNSIDTTLVPSLKGREDFYNRPILGSYMSIFNQTKKPFDDPRVRKAFSLVVDQNMITDRVLRSGFQPTHKLVPPVIPGYKSLIPEQAPMEERIKEARRLLAEAGYPDGKGFPQISYKYNTDESHHKIAQALQAAWLKGLGINVKLENQEWKVYLSEQKQKKYEISRLGWIGDYPDPATFLEIFMSHNDNNRTGWKNAEFDRLVREGLAQADEAKRMEIYAQAEKILFDETPMIGIYHYSYFGLINPNLSGHVPNPQGHHLFRYISKK